MTTLILVRRVLDSYASAAKARQTRRWRGADTTDMRVEAEFGHFRGWVRHQQRWYDDCRRALESAGRPVTVLRYDEHLDRDTGTLLDTLEHTLTRLGIEPGPRRDIEWVTRKQDATTDTREKFANWDTFERELEAADMLDLATGYLA